MDAFDDFLSNPSKDKLKRLVQQTGCRSAEALGRCYFDKRNTSIQCKYSNPFEPYRYWLEEVVYDIDNGYTQKYQHAPTLRDLYDGFLKAECLETQLAQSKSKVCELREESDGYLTKISELTFENATLRSEVEQLKSKEPEVVEVEVVKEVPVVKEKIVEKTIEKKVPVYIDNTNKVMTMQLEVLNKIEQQMSQLKTLDKIHKCQEVEIQANAQGHIAQIKALGQINEKINAIAQAHDTKDSIDNLIAHTLSQTNLIDNIRTTSISQNSSTSNLLTQLQSVSQVTNNLISQLIEIQSHPRATYETIDPNILPK